jgi:hypothetical protein
VSQSPCIIITILNVISISITSIYFYILTFLNICILTLSSTTQDGAKLRGYRPILQLQLKSVYWNRPRDFTSICCAQLMHSRTEVVISFSSCKFLFLWGTLQISWGGGGMDGHFWITYSTPISRYQRNRSYNSIHVVDILVPVWALRVS